MKSSGAFFLSFVFSSLLSACVLRPGRRIPFGVGIIVTFCYIVDLGFFGVMKGISGCFGDGNGGSYGISEGILAQKH